MSDSIDYCCPTAVEGYPAACPDHGPLLLRRMPQGEPLGHFYIDEDGTLHVFLLDSDRPPITVNTETLRQLGRVAAAMQRAVARWAEAFLSSVPRQEWSDEQGPQP